MTRKAIQMQKSDENKTVQEAFCDFIRFCQVKNLSEHTIAFYEQSFRIFGEFFNIDQSTYAINSDVINDYILHLQDNALSDTSIRSYIIQLRVFLHYCMDLGYIEKFKVTIPKAKKPVKETYTEHELALLLEKPNTKECRFAEYRNWAIVNYLLATGNRISTVINIKIKDLDFDSGVIHLKHTKNRREQIIPMSTKLEEVLQEYLLYRGGDGEDYLFPNQYGEQMTDNAMQIAIRTYNQSRGVMRTSCHAFRHTFAKHWILNKGDPFRLQKMLGHSSMDMVREYIEMFDEDLKRDFGDFNPLDQMMTKKEVIKMRK